jgi:uncharacterized integral membrane protein
MAGDGGSGRNVSPKMIVVGILIVIVVILALVNSQDIKVDFVVGDVTLPLFIVIVGSALIGLIVGYFIGRREKKD